MRRRRKPLTILRRFVGDTSRGASALVARRALRSPPAGARASVIGVYRAENAGVVRHLIDPALARGWTAAWWALDEVADELAEHTVGRGRGERLPLLNETIRHCPPADWLVVSDDDVAFVRGSVVDLVTASAVAGFSLSQPAHDVRSTYSHAITVARKLSIARRTNFVEIGPVFAVGPDCRDRIVPFPVDRGMGWGLELEWQRLVDDGCSLGIVDVVTVKHLGIVGASYERRLLTTLVERELAERGARRWEDVQATLATWRPWQTQPPWRRVAARRGRAVRRLTGPRRR